jgi:hypothetical protein
MPDKAALMMTKFMIPAAWGMPVWPSTLTKGLSEIVTLPPVCVQGISAATTASARK